ncbi:hypothetical protein LWI29_005178 [Acer saccharum]|uniref:Uncharacterized protein n=1 Tax=Acer saccharum TaxID=4024 RepID=A0AA39W066_ACESA|nr:hypothetical protein LWI29_005178 [Acer saccharum]
MAEEDSSLVVDKLEVVGGGESGVHEADQQQRLAISAVEYRDLLNVFLQGFKRHRVPLAPFDSTESQLCHILPLLNPKHTVIVQESVEEAAKALYVNVMRNASSVASNAACHLIGNMNKLWETISSFIKLSPYGPFGTYVFCTGNGRP